MNSTEGKVANSLAVGHALHGQSTDFTGHHVMPKGNLSP